MEQMSNGTDVVMQDRPPQPLLSEMAFRVDVQPPPPAAAPSSHEDLQQQHGGTVVAAPLSAEDFSDIGAAAQAAADAQINVGHRGHHELKLSSLATAASSTTPSFHIGKKIDEEPPLALSAAAAAQRPAPLGAATHQPVVSSSVIVDAVAPLVVDANEDQGGPRTSGRQRRALGSPRSQASAPSSTGKTKGDYQKKYRATDKGRAAQKKAQEKYRRSDKGKTAQMRARKKWRETHPNQRGTPGAPQEVHDMGSAAGGGVPVAIAQQPPQPDTLPKEASLGPPAPAMQLLADADPGLPPPSLVAPPSAAQDSGGHHHQNVATLGPSVLPTEQNTN